MEKTIVGLFDEYEDAQNVVRDLEDEGFARGSIQIMMNDDQGDDDSLQSSSRTGEASDSGSGIAQFFRSLFGGDNDTASGSYHEAIKRGGVLVSVDAETDEQIELATDIMDRYNVVDIEERAAYWGGADGSYPESNGAPLASDEAGREWQSGGAKSVGSRARPDDETTLPVMEEELQIGKRVVQRGGVRVYSRMTETPVSEDVTLREEHVRVQRRPANRAVDDAELSAFREGSIELTETAEEAVIAKHARVVEEVIVSKDVDERIETVHDTVRRTDVEVEPLGFQPYTGTERRRPGASSTYTGAERRRYAA